MSARDDEVRQVLAGLDADAEVRRTGLPRAHVTAQAADGTA